MNAGAGENRPDPAALAGQTPAAPAEFLNRELSWLEFNRRVLHEALDERDAAARAR